MGLFEAVLVAGLLTTAYLLLFTAARDVSFFPRSEAQDNSFPLLRKKKKEVVRGKNLELLTDREEETV